MPSRSPEPVFVQSTHAGSRRSAIVDDVEGSIWLYLLPAGGSRPEQDCWLANTIADDEQMGLEHYRSQGAPPPAAPEVMTAGGVLAGAASRAWELRWSADGEAVAAICDGQVRGFVCAQSRKSFAFHLGADGPWGLAWSQQAYDDRFGR